MESFVDSIDTIRECDRLWDLFSLKGEYDPWLLDKYSRTRFYSNRHDDVLTPIVSEALHDKMNITYPNNFNFAICLSHDIDTVYNTKMRAILYSIRSLREAAYKKTFRHVLGAIGRFYPRWNYLRNFDQIMELEKRYDATSTFFFFATRKKLEEHNYRLSDMRTDIDEIIRKGWDVALHGSRASHSSFEEMEWEIRHFEDSTGQKLTGYRNHGLHFKTPDTWRYLEQAGILYDTTVGYPDMVGFRNGMCHPYYPYDREGNRFMKVLEIPLIIMDGTLFDYMRLDYDTAWTMTKYLIDGVAARKGAISILWHNDALCDDIQPEWKCFYERILSYCRENNAWLTSCENVNRFFQQRYSGFKEMKSEGRAG